MPDGAPLDSLPPMLCESCGYDISETPPERTCPECGVAVSLSRPERRDLLERATTRWQLIAAMLSTPRAAMRAAPIGDPRVSAFGNAMRNAATALVCVAMVVPAFFHAPVQAEPPAAFALRIAITAVWLLVAIIGLYLALTVLTAIESIGIRFFGRQRGWRISPDVAWTVCHLASVGWLVGAGVVSFGALLMHVGMWNISIGLLEVLFLSPYEMGVVLIFLGAVTGLMYFELLVYLGVRQCRFANPARVRRYDASGGLLESAGVQRADREP